MRIIPLNLFAFDEGAKILSADISDLGPHPFHQVFPDSCDEGITILSHHTGEEVTFFVNRIETDSEREILSWELIPTDACLRRNSRLNGLTVKLYND